MSPLRARLQAMGRRHRSVDFLLAVVAKYFEDRGGALAAQLAYYAFFSVFPLLLVLSTALGFVLHAEPGWQHAVERSAFAQLPLVTSSDQPAPLHGNPIALAIGIVLALWSGLLVVRAAQSAFDIVYEVDWEHPGLVRALQRAFVTLVIGGTGLVATTMLSAAVTTAERGAAFRVAGIVVAVLVDTVVLLVVFRRLTVRELAWRAVLPGAVMASVVLQVLQLGATALIDRRLAHVTSTYGRNIGTVIVMLSWFTIQAKVVLLAAEVNVVRQDGRVDTPNGPRHGRGPLDDGVSG